VGRSVIHTHATVPAITSSQRDDCDKRCLLSCLMESSSVDGRSRGTSCYESAKPQALRSELRPTTSCLFHIDMAKAISSIGTYLAHGASGIVERCEEAVIKRPYPDNNSSLHELKIEARIYQHLGSHPRVVRFLSWDDDQSILRIEYMKNGNLKSFITSDQCSLGIKIRWVKQAGDAIQVFHPTKQKALSELNSTQFLHSRDVIHCDIKPDNFLLDEKLDLKVCDFAGSSLYGSKALVCGSTRFWRPTLPKTPCEAQDDIFALGSTIYMIFTGKEPFGDLDSVEVEARFSSAEFPDTSNLPFDDVIQSCWGGRADIHQVCSSIERSMQQMQKSEQPWDFFGELLRLSSHLYTTCLESVRSVTRSQT
jgi:serine/threonine protein kinase